MVIKEEDGYWENPVDKIIELNHGLLLLSYTLKPRPSSTEFKAEDDQTKAEIAPASKPKARKSKNLSNQ